MTDDHQRPSRELLESLRRLSDDELVARLKSLAARERRATALVVAHLAELDARDLHLRAGCPSLFIYCRDVLALSEHEAYNRMEVARTGRRFPVVFDLLAEGSVNLTTVRLLGPHLTAENHAKVLEAARGKRKSEVEEIVARLAPRLDVPPSVRKLPARSGFPEGASSVTSSEVNPPPGRCHKYQRRSRVPRSRSSGSRIHARHAAVGRRRAIRSRAHPPAGRSRPEEVRLGRERSPLRKGAVRFPLRAGGGEARRPGARPRALRVRGAGRPPLP
jgi:hypothetical protein